MIVDFAEEQLRARTVGAVLPGEEFIDYSGVGIGGLL